MPGVKRERIPLGLCVLALALAGVMRMPVTLASDSTQGTEAPVQVEPAVLSVRVAGPTALYSTDSAGRVVSVGTAPGPWLKIPAVHPEDDKDGPSVNRKTAPTADPIAEENMLRLVNCDRAKSGLPPMVMDETLRAVARGHSTDMAKRGYFGHKSPDGDSVNERLRRRGIVTRFAAENLALGGDTELACRCIMASSRHKANILNPKARRIGIGVVASGGAMWFTQVIAD